MATHRRGSRPSQWPVRDLLGQQRSRFGELWDPRVAAAVSGLLACGAAVSVAFTVGDAAPPSRPDVLAPAPAGPRALPAPSGVVPAPDPGPVVPAPTPGARRSPPGTDPVPRAWRVPAGGPRTSSPAADRRSRSVQEIVERLADEVAAVQDGRNAGVLVVPVQREADVTALVERARHGEAGGGRHRASASGDDHDRDDDRADREDDRAHTADAHRREDRDGRADRDDCDHAQDLSRAAPNRATRVGTDRNRAEQDRAQQDRAGQDHAEQDHAEQDRAEQDRAEQDRAEQDRADLVRTVRDPVDRDRAARHRADRNADRDADRGDADRGDADRGDADRGDADRGDADRTSAAHHERADHDTGRHHRAAERAWSAADWFGDEDHGDEHGDDHGDDHADQHRGEHAGTTAQHASGHGPAMAVLVTRTDDERGGLTTRHIDSRAVLAALDGLS